MAGETKLTEFLPKGRCHFCRLDRDAVWRAGRCGHLICDSCQFVDEKSEGCLYCRTGPRSVNNADGFASTQMDVLVLQNHHQGGFSGMFSPGMNLETGPSRELLRPQGNERPKRLLECDHCRGIYCMVDLKDHALLCDVYNLTGITKEDLEDHLAVKECYSSAADRNYVVASSKAGRGITLSGCCQDTPEYIQELKETVRKLQNEIDQLRKEKEHDVGGLKREADDMKVAFSGRFSELENRLVTLERKNREQNLLVELYKEENRRIKAGVQNQREVKTSVEGRDGLLNESDQNETQQTYTTKVDGDRDIEERLDDLVKKVKVIDDCLEVFLRREADDGALRLTSLEGSDFPRKAKISLNYDKLKTVSWKYPEVKEFSRPVMHVNNWNKNGSCFRLRLSFSFYKDHLKVQTEIINPPGRIDRLTLLPISETHPEYDEKRQGAFRADAPRTWCFCMWPVEELEEYCVTSGRLIFSVWFG